MMMSFKGLVSEDNKNISLGRITFWMLFVICLYFWIFKDPAQFPNTIIEVLFFIMAYNFFKKPVDVWNKHINLKYGQSEENQLTPPTNK